MAPRAPSLRQQLSANFREQERVRRDGVAALDGVWHTPRQRGQAENPNGCARGCPRCRAENRTEDELWKLQERARDLEGELVNQEMAKQPFKGLRHVGQTKADPAEVLKDLTKGEKHAVVAKKHGISLKAVGRYVKRSKEKSQDTQR